MTKILNKLNIVNEKTSERTSFDFKGQGGSGDYMKVAVTLSSEPTISTLSYNGIDFVIGDLVRVADNNSETGYSFYRLHDISNGEAVWSKLATGEVDDSAVITVNMESNQSNDSEFTGGSATISYGQTTETKTGTSAQFTVPAGTSYTITLNSITGYGGQKFSSNSSSTITGTASEYGRISYTGTYYVEILSITSLSIDEGSLNGQVVTVNGVSKTYGTDSLPWTWRIPYGISDAVIASKSGYNLTITKSPNTDIADSVSKSVTIAFTEIKNGVFAAYSDGTLKEYGSADSNAIGVAVITDNCSFIIDKNATSNNTYVYYGGYDKDLSSTAVTTSDSTTAKKDFRGKLNTTNIINACSGYNDGTSTGAPAAEACRAAFNGKGYLGSLGEWQEAYNNKSSVDLMMTKIGGTALLLGYHWSSTHYNASYASWLLYWGSGYVYNYSRNDYTCVRAFCAFPFAT